MALTGASSSAQPTNRSAQQQLSCQRPAVAATSALVLGSEFRRSIWLWRARPMPTLRGGIRTLRGRGGSHGGVSALFALIPLLFGLSASHSLSALENTPVKRTYRIAVVDSGSGAVPATFQDELAKL